MKSQFNLNRVGSCIWFAVVVAIALSFSGCCSNPDPGNGNGDGGGNGDYPPLPPPPETIHLMPLDDHIISQVGGLAAMEKTALYVSNVLTLKLAEVNQEFMAVGERIVRTSEIFNDTIIIRPTDSGFLSSLQEGPILYVAFGLPSTSNLAFPFSKQGASERYEILFMKTNNPEDRIIDFGIAKYTVTYGGNERNETPYLQFELKDDVRFR